MNKSVSLTQLPLHDSRRLLFEVARYISLLKVEGITDISDFLEECQDADLSTREDLNEFVLSYRDFMAHNCEE